MNHCVIGTAGHIDHGKTELIKALTGRDTDTKKEEKQRGITIDLGYTYFELDNGKKAGIVDVPGHEKFLTNMLAGVCGMDLVLLVIALDDGIKPQTIEHLEILTQAGIESGIIVLTKVDAVDEEWADMVEEEIAESMKGSICEKWPRIRVSSTEGTGIEALRQMIIDQIQDVEKRKIRVGKFRMPIDRVLTLEGRGTVIAGTVLEGNISVGDVIEIYPSQIKARVRSVQSHGGDVEKVQSGQRAALLLANVKKEEISRGNVAAEEESLCLSERLDVKVKMSKYTKRTLKNRARVHLHIGTVHLIGRVILFGCEEIIAGEICYAQIILEKPVAVKKEDRFVIRFYSPTETIGGGYVLENNSKRHKRSDSKVIEYFQNLEKKDEDAILWRRLQEKRDGLFCQNEFKTEEFERMEKWNISDVVILRDRKTSYITTKDALEAWADEITEWMKQERKLYPYKRVFSKNEIKRALFSKWELRVFESIMNYFKRTERFEITVDAIGSKECAIKKDVLFEKARVECLNALEQAKFQLISVEELCPMQMDKECYRDVLEVMEHEGELVKLSDQFYVTREQMDEVIQVVGKVFMEKEVLTYTELRDLLQTTRKSIKILIAFLDQMKITQSFGKETERRKGAEFIEFFSIKEYNFKK